MNISTLLAKVRAIKAALGEVPDDAQRRCIGCEPAVRVRLLVLELERELTNDERNKNEPRP